MDLYNPKTKIKMKYRTILFGLLLVVVSMVATGCNSCQSGNNKQETVETYSGDIDGVVPDMTASVENIVALNRQTMYKEVNADKYIFYEVDVLLKNDMSDEDCTGEVLAVNSVFQAQRETADGVYCTVYMIETDGKGTHGPVAIPNAFYIEDCPLNDAPMPITFAQAFARAMEANAPKPDSPNAVLRIPVGPKPCNAQWIFGGMRGPNIFVDAYTGEVRTTNPAF